MSKLVVKTVELKDGTRIQVKVPEGSDPSVAFKKANSILRDSQNMQRSLEKGVQASAKKKSTQKNLESVFGRERDDNYWKYMKRLQDKYGDDTTYYKAVSPGFLPRNTYKYDEEELVKRAARDAWGTTPRDPTALETLGRTFVQLGKGVKQPFGLTDKEKRNLKEEELIWSAAEHPLSSEAGAMALTMAPSFGTMPFLYTTAGKVLGSQTLKGVGEMAARRQAGMGSFPKTSAAIGAAYGAALPHDPDASTKEALYTRMTNALASGGTNYAFTHLMHGLPDAARTSQYIKDRNALQKDLPVKVREHPFDVYGSSQAKNKFKQFVGQQSGTGDRATSADATVLNDLRDSIGKTFEGMFGRSTVRPIGEAMNEVWDKFKDRYTVSRNRMNRAYDDIPGNLNMVVSNKGEYNNFVKELEGWLANEGLDIKKGKIGEAVKALKQVSIYKNRPINVNGVKKLINTLNRIEREIGDNPELRSSRRGIGHVRSQVYDYLANAKWDPAGGRVRNVPGTNVEAIEKWRKAQVLARNHYQRFHGDYDVDNMIMAWQKGDKKESPSDLSSRIFLGSAGTMDVSAGRRVAAIDKLRQGIGDDTFFNPRIKEEAISSLSKGGYKGKEDVNTLMEGVNQHVIQGNYSDLFSPEGYTGAAGIFSAKELRQLQQLSGVHRRYTDPHMGITSTTRDETTIPNNLLSRTIQDTLLNESGPFGVQWAGKLGEQIRSLSPKGVRNLSQERMDDRIIRRHTAGLMGNYGPQIPAPMVGPMATSMGNQQLTGEMSNPNAQDTLDFTKYLLRNYPALKGLLD